MKNKNKIYKFLLWTSLVLMLSIFSFEYIDKQLFNFVHKSNFPNNLIHSFKILDKIFDPDTWAILLFVSGIYFIVDFYRKKKISKKIILPLSLFIGLVVTLTLKFVLARYRPECLSKNNLYGFHWISLKHKYNSMPSGHASMGFAGLIAIASITNKKNVMLIAVFLATFIAITRIILQKHFLSDVIIGSYIGVLSYSLSMCFYKKYNK